MWQHTCTHTHARARAHARTHAHTHARTRTHAHARGCISATSKEGGEHGADHGDARAAAHQHHLVHRLLAQPSVLEHPLPDDTQSISVSAGTEWLRAAGFATHVTAAPRRPRHDATASDLPAPIEFDQAMVRPRPRDEYIPLAYPVGVRCACASTLTTSMHCSNSRALSDSNLARVSVALRSTPPAKDSTCTQKSVAAVRQL
jgi:hypothetical protein